MPAQRIAEGGALFDVVLDIAERRLKDLVVLLVGQDIEALYERQTGVDHGGETAA